MIRAIASPLVWHGGKSHLAPKIVARMPGHTHYVETHAGGLSVLLAKDPEGVSEVVNDTNGRLTNFWNVLKCPVLFGEFARLCAATPFSEHEWDVARLEALALAPDDRPAVLAHRFFVHVRQSMSGRMELFSALTGSRTRRGMNQQVSAWLSAVEGLSEVHARLIRVAVRNRDALTVIRQEDGPDTLFYCDPPYLHATRVTKDAYYDHEMTDKQHELLLKALAGIQGRFLLSGYRSDLYDAFAKRCGWKRTDFEVPKPTATRLTNRTRRAVECLWAN